MKTTRSLNLGAAALVCALAFSTTIARAADALPSWIDGKSKQSTVEFVKSVTTKGGKDFVPPAERIATFDNDGTLWVEQPMYFQLRFALDRVKALDKAQAKGWTVVDMKNDWKTIFPTAGK